ncbi:MAG: TIGR00725 family protein [Methanoregula sp.]|nr:TIGR00725 family protein [Methanoregula sp.]
MGQIAVIGAADPTPEEYEAAHIVGSLIAKNHETLVCGGLYGIMEAACKGAKEQDGLTIGIVPDTGTGNQYLDIVIRTGLGHARNVIVAQSADAVVAIGGGYGTLSEIAIALKMKRPVFGVKTWDIEGVIRCPTPEEAVLRAVHAARQSLLYRIPQDFPGSP